MFIHIIINPFYNHALNDHFFFVTLMNWDLNVYSHIPYEPLQGCECRQNKYYKTTFCARINLPIV